MESEISILFLKLTFYFCLILSVVCEGYHKACNQTANN